MRMDDWVYYDFYQVIMDYISRVDEVQGHFHSTYGNEHEWRSNEVR